MSKNASSSNDAAPDIKSETESKASAAVTHEERSPDPGETSQRPWGKMTSLEHGPSYCINRISIDPGKHISNQMHYHRSEHWIVVSGTAKVVCGGKETTLIHNQSTYVPACTPHRVENPGVIPLVMIEVQNGQFLGDEDIVRFEEA